MEWMICSCSFRGMLGFWGNGREGKRWPFVPSLAQGTPLCHPERSIGKGQCAVEGSLLL
jgi:hypothetical protein